MFRFKAPPKRKRPLVTTTSTTHGSDDDDSGGGNDGVNVNVDVNVDVNDEGSKSTGDAIEAIKRKRKEKKKKQKQKRKHKQKQRMPSAAALSFQMDDEDDDDEDADADDSDKKSRKKMKKNKLKKKQKRGGGLGYGGGMQPADIDMDMDVDMEDEGRGQGNNYNGNGGSSLYGKGELEKLRSEQKVYIAEKKEKSSNEQESGLVGLGQGQGLEEEGMGKTDTVAMERGASQVKGEGGRGGDEDKVHMSNGGNDRNAIPLPPAPIKQVPKPPPLPMEEDFISFNSKGGQTSSQPTIVAGDDALKYTMGEENYGDDDGIGIDRDELGTTVLSSGQRNDPNGTKAQEAVFEGKLYNMGADDDAAAAAEEDEGGRKWEEEIAKRAGVNMPQQGSPIPGSSSERGCDHDHSHSEAIGNDRGKQIISQIKNTIATSLENLKQQDLDMESDLVRRKHEAEMARKDAKTKEEDMRSIGERFEYYQTLRSDVADWAGALRYLSQKITVIEEALEDLYNDVGSKQLERRMEWQDDQISVLNENNILDYVVGRQPISITASKGGKHEAIVDEFGRDVRSMVSVSYNKRRMERKRIRRESRARRRMAVTDQNEIGSEQDESDLDSDADVSDHEMLDREERRCALGDAVQVLFDEMDENFSSIHLLLGLFQRWKNMYEDDYKQCYANMALVEFIAIFARAESCKHLDLQGFAYKGLNRGKKITTLHEFSWFDQCKPSNLLSETELDCLAQNMCSQAFRFTVSGLTNDTVWPYDPYSKRQSRALSSFFGEILKNTSTVEEQSKIYNGILDYINSYVQKMAVAVVKKKTLTTLEGEGVSGDDGDKLFDAVLFSTIGQLRSLGKLVYNLVTFWHPIFNNKSSKATSNVAKFCLVDIMTYRFLPILDSSIITNATADEKTKTATCVQTQAIDAFVSIWNIMKDAKLLDDDNLMLQSSPMRAAAVRIGIEQK